MSGIVPVSFRQHVRHFLIFAIPAAFICAGIVLGGSLVDGLASGLVAVPIVLPLMFRLVRGPRPEIPETEPILFDPEGKPYANFGSRERPYQPPDPVYPYVFPMISGLFLSIPALFCLVLGMFALGIALFVLVAVSFFAAAQLIRHDAPPVWRHPKESPKAPVIASLLVLPFFAYSLANLTLGDTVTGDVASRSLIYDGPGDRNPDYRVFIALDSGRSDQVDDMALFQALDFAPDVVQGRFTYSRFSGELVEAEVEGQKIRLQPLAGALTETVFLGGLVGILLLGAAGAWLFGPDPERKSHRGAAT